MTWPAVLWLFAEADHGFQPPLRCMGLVVVKLLTFFCSCFLAFDLLMFCLAATLVCIPGSDSDLQT